MVLPWRGRAADSWNKEPLVLSRLRCCSALLVAGLYLTYCPLAAVADEAAVGEAALTAMRQQLPLLTTLPFMLLLLAIAILPLLAGHWWERNRNKALVVVALAAPVVLYLTSVWADAGRSGPM